MTYDYVIIGAGIAGSTTAYFLNKTSQNILVLEKNSTLKQSASAAAGAFLSPLLGKPNEFKDLVNEALVFSSQFYQENCPEFINNCGTLRIPKDQKAKEQFESYKPYIDFEYSQKEDGFFFPIGSVVQSSNICQYLLHDISTRFDYEVTRIVLHEDIYIINDEIKTKNLILTTGANISSIKEEYFNIRPVWGQRIDIETTTQVPYNYHKACSLSVSTQTDENRYKCSIGATHHRFVLNKEVDSEDTNSLLTLANDIKKLKNIKVINEIAGARASSVDYFPMVGELIDSQATLEKYPYIKHGSKVPMENYIAHKNLYVLNGVGGRGFVLSPYLAYHLVQNIINNQPLSQSISTHRLFQRWSRKLKD